MNRYKIVQVGERHKTVNRADPTCITRVDDVRVVSYHNKKERAINRVLKLIEQRELQSEMDHSWGAPPECFENMVDDEWYIVDRETNQWYYVSDDYGTGGNTLVETTPVSVQKSYVM